MKIVLLSSEDYLAAWLAAFLDLLKNGIDGWLDRADFGAVLQSQYDL